jgi:hypothetical protein
MARRPCSPFSTCSTARSSARTGSAIERQVPPDRKIYVILDKLMVSTPSIALGEAGVGSQPTTGAAHKHAKVRAWLTRRWTFHFTPTSCSPPRPSGRVPFGDRIEGLLAFDGSTPSRDSLRNTRDDGSSTARSICSSRRACQAGRSSLITANRLDATHEPCRKAASHRRRHPVGDDDRPFRRAIAGGSRAVILATARRRGWQRSGRWPSWMPPVESLSR